MDKNPNEMSFLDHLEELRWHLIRSSLAIVILASVAFIAKDFIFDTIILDLKKLIFQPINGSVIFQNLSDKVTAFVSVKCHLEFKAGR